MSSGRHHHHKCKLHSRGSKSSERFRGQMETISGGPPFLDMSPLGCREGNRIDWGREDQDPPDASPMLRRRKASFSGYIGDMDGMGPGVGMRRLDDMSGYLMDIPGTSGDLPARVNGSGEFMENLGREFGGLENILRRRAEELGLGLQELDVIAGMREVRKPHSTAAFDAEQGTQAQKSRLGQLLARGLKGSPSPDRPGLFESTPAQRRSTTIQDVDSDYLHSFSPARRLTAKGLAVLGPRGLGADLEGRFMGRCSPQTQDTRSIGRNLRQLSASPPKGPLGTSFQNKNLNSLGMDRGGAVFKPSRGNFEGRPLKYLSPHTEDFQSRMEAVLQLRMTKEQMATAGHSYFEQNFLPVPQALINAGRRRRYFL